MFLRLTKTQTVIYLIQRVTSVIDIAVYREVPAKNEKRAAMMHD